MGRWPMQLQQNEKTCVRFMSTGSPTVLPLHHSQERADSSGLSVRGDSNASDALPVNGNHCLSAPRPEIALHRSLSMPELSNAAEI